MLRPQTMLQQQKPSKTTALDFLIQAVVAAILALALAGTRTHAFRRQNFPTPN